ncbi:hypothetical protein TSUD_249070 [Trifolium subterraneum]|nr:hypothetical protein TSUD_249070 [Trifolium subterraneum]
MSVHQGFIRGTKPGRNTGFDIDEDDLHRLGDFDEINEPKNISDYSRKTARRLMQDGQEKLELHIWQDPS